MQEVFEKIIEKLEELQNYACFPTEWVNEEQSKIHSYYANKLTEILKLTEKYNNGWIPVSERLPNEAYGCLVTVMDCEPSTQTEFENILPYFVGYDGETWNDADGEEIPFEVIAWQKLPQPYQPKGE